jgi:hypothetical protein
MLPLRAIIYKNKNISNFNILAIFLMDNSRKDPVILDFLCIRAFWLYILKYIFSQYFLKAYDFNLNDRGSKSNSVS